MGDTNAAPQVNIPASQTTPETLTFAGTFVRSAMLMLAGYLVRKGIMPEGHTAALVEVGTGLILAGLAIGWSLLQKWVARKALLTALALPPGSTTADVKKITKLSP